MPGIKHLIAGRWTSGAGSRSLTVSSPFDDTPVTQLRPAGEAEVAEAVQAAQQAALIWAATSPADRAAAVHEAADVVRAAADGLAMTMTAEMGKPVSEAHESILAGAATLRQYAELGPAQRGRALAGEQEAIDLMAYGPRGVVAALTPWNDPVAVSCGLLGAALVTGNA